VLTEEYAKLRALEDTYWWHTALRQLVVSWLETLPNRSALRVLDTGCGTGGLLTELQGMQSWGVELADVAVQHCRRRGLGNVVQGSVMTLPFRADTFDVVISLDVLYHQWVPDDVEALRELHRVLRPGGLALLHLPAYRFLTSEHDAAGLGRRRYTRPELAAKVRASGFRVARLTYRNALLLPLALAHRWTRRRRRDAPPRSDLVTLPPALNALLRAVLALENDLVRRVTLPFGLSLFCIAAKEGSLSLSA
jgi:SAM-dependent methyltransferase